MAECVEQLEWSYVADVCSDEQKNALRADAITECELMRQEVHDDSQNPSLFTRAREAAFTLLKTGEQRIKHLTFSAAIESIPDIALAAECLGRMRAGPLDQEVISRLGEKNNASAIAKSWKQMDDRRIRTPQHVVFLSPSTEDVQEASTAELVEMVVDLLRQERVAVEILKKKNCRLEGLLLFVRGVDTLGG